MQKQKDEKMEQQFVEQELGQLLALTLQLEDELNSCVECE
jgi:hypothetical protein